MIDKRRVWTALSALYPHYCCGPAPGRKPPRNNYRWGHYNVLRNLEVGVETIVGKGDKREWGLFRTMACNIGKSYGIKISTRYADGIIYATRII